jgi:hypothetical protein
MCPTSRNPQLSEREKNLLASSRWKPDTKTDCHSQRNFNFKGYNWATIFLGDINTGTWPYRLGSLKNGDKICSLFLRDSDQRKIALEMPSNN